MEWNSAKKLKYCCCIASWNKINSTLRSSGKYMKGLRKIFFSFLFSLVSAGLISQINAQDVIKASGATEISIDSTITGGYVTIDGPTIRETGAGQLEQGQDIILTLPSGYEWNTSLTAGDLTLTIEASGANNTDLDVSFSGFNNTQEAVFTVDSESETKGNGKGPGRLDIQGLQLRPADTNIPDVATITNEGTTGPDLNYGDLSKVAGSPAEVLVETQPDGSGQIVQQQDILAGNQITVYSVARDVGGNFVENIALSNESDWSLIDITGSVTQAGISAATDLRSAVFSSQQTGAAKIQAFLADVTVTPSQEITVLPREADQMTIQTQPPSSATAGEAFSNAIVVHLEDQFGNLVTTNSSTQATIGIGSGEGSLSGTLTQTASNGVITFSGLSADIANNITLEITSSGLNTITTNSISVDHNQAVDLNYVQQPTNTAQNGTIEPAVELQLIDDFGNTVDSVVTVSISNESYWKNSSTLSADTDASGVVTFANLNLSNNATIGTASFDASFTGINAPVTSANFEIISSDDLANFVIQNLSETNIGEQEAGQSFDIRIRALDGNGDVFTSFTDTLRLTSNSDIQVNGIDVPALTTDNFVNGELDTSITLTTSGLSRIFAENEAVNRTGQSNEFNVTPTNFDVAVSQITANPTEIVADGSSTSDITVQLKDEFGNNVLSGGETVALTTDAGTLSGGGTTTTATDQNDGTYTSTLTSSSDANDLATITGTVNSNSITDNATVDFVPGGVESFVITLPETASEPDTQTAGTPFNIDIEALDASGNRVVDFNGNVTISSSSVISSGASATLSGGFLSGHSITLTEADTSVTLTVTADDLFEINGVSEEFVVVAGTPDAANSAVVANPKVLQNEGSTTSLITIILRDEFGNRVLTEQPVGLSVSQIEQNDNPSPDGNADASLSSVTWNPNPSNYTATLTPTTTVELIELIGTFGSLPTTITDRDTVDIVVPNTWTGGAGGPPANRTDWTKPGNWTSGVPTSDDFVIIPSGPDPPILDLNIDIGSLLIESGVSLTLFGGNAISVSGNVEINGILDIEDNTGIDIDGNFIGSGSFSSGDNTEINVEGNTTISSFLARTTGTSVTFDGSAPQNISTPNFLAQELIIQNDVAAVSGNQLIDVNVLDIASGFTFEMTTGINDTLDVQQNITGDGNFILNDNAIVLRGNLDLGNIDASEGTVIFGIRPGETDFSGLSPQQVSTLSEMQNAIINNPNGVQTFEDIIIGGNLTLENGPLIISSGKSLIASNISYNNGTLRMRRGINATQGWRMLSAPLDTTFADFLDKTVTQGYPNSSLGNAPADSLQPNVLWYDETDAESDEQDNDGNPLSSTDNDRWRAPNDANDKVTAGRGYFVYFFGDIDADPRYNTGLPLTLDIEGREHDGNGTSFTFPVTYTADADTGWNLIGNPFAATIDWDDGNWTKTNMDNVIYVWDP